MERKESKETFNKKCVISVNVVSSICLCPDLHCFLRLRKWTRLKLNISKLGAEILLLIIFIFCKILSNI